MRKVLSAVAVVVFVSSAAKSEAARPRAKEKKQQTSEAAAVVKEVSPLFPPVVFEGISSVRGALNRPGVELPQSDATSIVQDKIGFIWIGTEGGLARYDGVRIKSYKKGEDDRTISGSHITSLAADDTGGVWIGTFENGINFHNPETDRFERIVHDDKDSKTLADDAIFVLHIGPSQTLWIGAGEQGHLDAIDLKTRALSHVLTPEDVGAAITAIYEDADKSVWIGTAGAGLFRFDPTAKTLTRFQANERLANTLSSDSINALLRDSKGTLWIGTGGGGLAKMTGKEQFTAYRADLRDRTTISNDNVTALLEDRAGRFWVATGDGINELDRDSGKFTQYRTAREYAETKSYPKLTRAAYQDRSGVLWFPCKGDGVLMIDELRLRLGYSKPANMGFVFWSFAEDKNGVVWGASLEDGLFAMDRRAGTVTKYLRLGDPSDEKFLDLQAHWQTAVYADNKGTVWVALKGVGLLAFDPARGTYKVHPYDPDNPRALQAERVEQIVPDESGNLWLASLGSGVVHFNTFSGVFTHYSTDENRADSVSSDFIYTLARDKSDENTMWVGTAGGGLNKLDMKNGTVKRFVHDPNNPKSISDNDVTTIYQDPAGSLWLGTYEGHLNRFDPKSGEFERIGAKDGLLNDTVYGILADSQGRLWMSTNGAGLAVFDPETRAFTYFHKADGLQGDEFQSNAYLKTRNGEMYFVGPAGFNVFRPEEIKPDDYKPPIVLTAVKRFNEELELEHAVWNQPEIKLSYSDMFSVEFAALSYSSPDKHKFQYLLEGQFDEWIKSDDPISPTTKLDGGDYVLRVKAANRHGAWNESEVSLKIHVTPPPWKSWWAYGIYLLSTAGVALGYMRYQASRLKALQKENRLAAVERDLELTGAVQTGFLPKESRVQSDAIRLRGFYRPADVCSGDWWWYDPLEGGRLFVLVGDVTGHGPGPAMVTAAVATAFRVQAKGGIPNLVDRLHGINEEVLAVSQGKYHMTMTALELDERTGKFSIYGAGGIPAIKLAGAGQTKVLLARGTPLGDDTFKIGKVEGTLETGDRLLLFTDGIPEIVQPNGRMLGMQGVSKIYQKTRDKSIDEAVAELIQGADLARNNATQDDDWTLVIVEKV